MEVVLAGVVLVALTLYILTGGADYGGGVWDLLASGKRANQQRELISKAIGPIWEANHVWLILVVVLLFTVFPRSFSLISISLHIPLTLMLIGIVLRGSAFAFRSYDTGRSRIRWGVLFASASTITPVLLGIIIGAIASGNITLSAFDFYRMYVKPWLALFPIAVGALTLALFAQLAAVYLTLETDDLDLQNDFRKRAILTSILTLILAALCYWLADNGAHFVFRNLHSGWWARTLKGFSALLALLSFAALLTRRYRIARLCSAGFATMILWGWALAQFPYLIVPHFTIFDAAPDATLKLVLIALIAGSLLLFPSFYYLFRIFKPKTPTQ
jgi:cytochrome d ubiquinol oxidase subunit II